MAIDGKELLNYACAKFQDGAYDEALAAFVLAYSKGYEPEWVMKNIYHCYMAGNEEEFRNAYERWTESTGITYEDCILDFIPYKDGEYYIFDKEKNIFRGVFSVHELQEVKPDLSLQSVEFSAAVLEMEWDWKEEAVILSEAVKRKVYLISHDVKRCISFCKIPELAEYVKNIKIFSDHQELQDYFHQNTSVYLPKIICGKEEDKQELMRIMDEEHQYRLTPEGRNTENILLTIGIPTHDRGNLLLERIENLCKMPYDCEVEFAVSKHGTRYYQNEYKSVEAMGDARINYVGCDEELGISGNWQKAVKIAHGKFVLLVSDEDDVILGALEHYFRVLSDHETLGYVRPKTVVQYRSLNEDQYYEKGKDAFAGGFLRQNYLSGTIYNRRMFEDADIAQYDLKYKDNDFFYVYPHMWWQVAMSFKGDYAEDSRCLIQEGDSVWKEETQKYAQDGFANVHGATKDKPELIEIVASYEARLKQFRGIVALIKDCKEFDDELRKKAVFIAIGKTYSMMYMSRDICKDSEEEFTAWIERLIEEVLAAMEELRIKPEDQKLVLTNMMMWIDKTIEQIEQENDG